MQYHREANIVRENITHGFISYRCFYYMPLLKYSNIHKIINLYPISKFIRVTSTPRIGDNKTILKQYLHNHDA